jgi:hypothetical protein
MWRRSRTTSGSGHIPGGEVVQAGVFRAADAVFAAGVAAVPQFQVGELAAFSARGSKCP